MTPEEVMDILSERERPCPNCGTEVSEFSVSTVQYGDHTIYVEHIPDNASKWRCGVNDIPHGGEEAVLSVHCVCGEEIDIPGL